MTGSVALDVVIGLVFIFLIYSLLATTLFEIFASLTSSRSKILETAIARMLDDDGGTTWLSDAFWTSPHIKFLGEKTDMRPAYINSKNFSATIVDILRGPSAKPGDDFKNEINDTLNGSAPAKHALSANLTTLATGDTFKYLKSLWADSQGDVEKFKLLLEQWFDEMMDRTGGWYKKKSQYRLFWIGVVMAVIFNVDTIMIVGKLSTNPKLSAELAAQADNFIKAHPNLGQELEQQQKEIDDKLKAGTITPVESNKEKANAEKVNRELAERRAFLLDSAENLIKRDISKINSTLGAGIHTYRLSGHSWRDYVGQILLSILGWAITAVAISLGAPFWFDLLNKVMKLRSSIAPAQAADTGDPNKKTEKKAINPKG